MNKLAIGAFVVYFGNEFESIDPRTSDRIHMRWAIGIVVGMYRDPDDPIPAGPGVVAGPVKHRLRDLRIVEKLFDDKLYVDLVSRMTVNQRLSLPYTKIVRAAEEMSNDDFDQPTMAGKWEAVIG